MGSIERILSFAVSIGGLLMVASAIALWIRARPSSLAARRSLLVMLTLYTAASIYVVPHSVNRLLASGFRVIERSDIGTGPVAIIVLGSGAPQYRGRSGASLTYLDASGANRVLEAHRVYQLASDAWVISSGGRISTAPDAPTTGGSMRDALVQLGVPPARILVEDTSQSTRDEAVLVAPMLRQLGRQRAIVVTSEFHMRRALAAFRALDIDAVPAIAPNQAPGPGWDAWLWPSAQSLAFSSGVVREVAAMAAYWARGWL